VVSGGLSGWRCWVAWLPLWLGHFIHLQWILGRKYLRHVRSRIFNARNPPTCIATLLNAVLFTVCCLSRWNESAELIIVVNTSRSWCWVSLMMRCDSPWSYSLRLCFVSRFFSLTSFVYSSLSHS
jgi:hypothetical protein